MLHLSCVEEAHFTFNSLRSQHISEVDILIGWLHTTNKVNHRLAFIHDVQHPAAPILDVNLDRAATWVTCTTTTYNRKCEWSLPHSFSVYL